MTGKKNALKTVNTIQNFQPRFWMPMGVISTMTKFVSLVDELARNLAAFKRAEKYLPICRCRNSSALGSHGNGVDLQVIK